MYRTFAGWSLGTLLALALASPVEGKPQAVTQDGSPSDSRASAPAPPPPPAPAPSAPAAPAPAPVPQTMGGGDSGRSGIVAAARQRSGRSGGTRQGGDRQGSSGGGAVARPRGSGTSSTASAEAERGDDRDRDRRAVRRGDRPRDGRAVVGTAARRTGPRSRPVVIPSWAWGRPSYWYGYNSLGLGYFYYDPYWWGYPGYGYGYGYGPGYGGYYGGYSRGHRDYYDRGQLRLKVKPRDAEVRVDGYFVGKVDEYDGVFQRLTLDSGPHRVEIRKPGFEPLVLDIRILPDETITYEGRLEPEP